MGLRMKNFNTYIERGVVDTPMHTILINQHLFGTDKSFDSLHDLLLCR